MKVKFVFVLAFYYQKFSEVARVKLLWFRELTEIIPHSVA